MTGLLPAYPDAAQYGRYAAALTAAAAAWLWATTPGSRRRSRTWRPWPSLPRAAVRAGRAAAERARADGGLAAAAGCLAVGAVTALAGASPLPLLAAALLAAPAARWGRRRVVRAAAARRADAVIDCCATVAAEVRAGRQPGPALCAAGTDGLGVPGAAVRAAARYGGDVPAALRAAADRPGTEGLRGVAACWQVAVDGGASLASGLDRVADALRAERDRHEDLEAQLAGPRATALMLAALPVFGLLLGTVMGAEPLRVLLHSPAGLACLAVGALLEWAGLAWVAALTRAAGRTVP